MLFSLARQNQQLCNILQTAYEKYDQSLADEIAMIYPDLSSQRRLHMAQMIRMILDGFGVQTAYDEPNSANMIALRGEIKTAVLSWLDMDHTR